MSTANGSGSGIMGVIVVPSLANTFGAILLGTCVGFMLYGLTVHQTYRYFRMYGSDIRLLKALVLLLCLTDTLHSIQSVHMCYYYLVSNHFKHDILKNGVWSLRLLIPVTTFMIIIAQCFYARRVFLIGARWIYTCVVILSGILMLGTLGFSGGATVETFIQQTLVNWQHYTWLTSTAFTFTLATDVILTTSLIAFLRSCRTGFKRTDGLLKILMVYTINTGLLTSTLSLLSLICAFAMPDNLIYAGLSIPATKLYANSVLSILNSRKSLASWSPETTGEDEFGTFGMSILRRHRFTDDAERRRSTLRTAVVDIRSPTRVVPGKNAVQEQAEEDASSVDVVDHKP